LEPAFPLVSARKLDVCVVGSFMMDLALQAPRRPGAGESVLGTAFEMFLGGKGFNQAVAAARSGASTALVGRVGRDDFGDRFLDCLHREGIDATHVHVDSDAGTGVAVPLVEPSGENSIIAVPRANHRVTAADVEAAASLITNSDVLLLQFELLIAPVLAAAHLAHDAGVTVILNPAPAVFGLAPFVGLIDGLVVNRAEAAALSATRADTPPALAATTLRELARCSVVVTLGADGALIADRDGDAVFAAFPVSAVDSVGAGDAFCGTLAASLARGVPLRDAIVYANAAGALAVTRRGAEPSMPSASDVAALVADPRLTRS
jgi:ribokinase